MAKPIDKSVEYEVLRQEMHTNKGYLLERPFIVLLAGVAGLNFVNEKILPLIPFIGIYFIAFVTWFNINRIRSNSRIVAYISVFLEKESPYIGWESYLRMHRNPLIRKEINGEEMEEEAKLESLVSVDRLRFLKGINTYYLIIALLFYFYSLLTVISTFTSIDYVTDNPSGIPKIMAILFFVFSSFSLIYLIKLIFFDFFPERDHHSGFEMKLAENILKYATLTKNAST